MIEYAIAIANSGADGADNLVLTDAVPSGTTFVPARRRGSGKNPL